jgi:hypothetical protein
MTTVTLDTYFKEEFWSTTIITASHLQLAITASGVTDMAILDSINLIAFSIVEITLTEYQNLFLAFGKFTSNDAFGVYIMESDDLEGNF